MSEQAFASEIERVLDQDPANGPLLPMPGETLSRRFRHNATIVTQLMAVKLDAPQTRARRRAGDAEGVAAYAATGDAIRSGLRVPGASWPV